MFTGIIEEVGRIARIDVGSKSGTLLIEAREVLQDVHLGDSIAVNGVCLTVTSYTASGFTADVMPETLRNTNLGSLKRGDGVNLERAMAMGDRFGGHIVSGHVDGTGLIASRESYANAILFRIKTEADLLRYMVPRGSVAVDGISLTITDVTAEGFSLSIIPHTLSHTNLQGKQAGDTVNLECDMIAKYVNRLIDWQQGEKKPPGKSGMNVDFLRQHGFV
ncbi:riboflavin synthase [Brevibacillus humidisoli]|uniref:riboflavin synthase n=1 Tax=Brevibacillus humidisoli TaxID=2895522 RepID=UPI001E359607|nr:riboflavin synthase [Brevibacillus humidisoli]UFJ41207.1 riboflavin synthase [Brevibacillus humidisoli]